MKRKVWIALSLLTCAGFATLHASKAPLELVPSVKAEIAFPGLAVGPLVDLLWFPLAIPIGGGRENLLGFGLTAGIYLNIIPAAGICIPLQGVFVGRFGLSKDLTIDWDVKLGAFIGANTMMVATTGLGFNLKGGLKPYAGVDFTYNPGYTGGYGTPEYLVCLVAGIGYAFGL